MGAFPVPFTSISPACPLAIAITLLFLLESFSGIATNVNLSVPVVVVSGTVVVLLSLTINVSALNPLSPLPGIACPFLGSWFLFTFSSVVSDLILFKMTRLLESCLACASTFSCVFVSSFKSSFALLTKFLASSMTDFVFLSSVN